MVLVGRVCNTEEGEKVEGGGREERGMGWKGRGRLHQLIISDTTASQLFPNFFSFLAPLEKANVSKIAVTPLAQTGASTFRDRASPSPPQPHPSAHLKKSFFSGLLGNSFGSAASQFFLSKAQVDARHSSSHPRVLTFDFLRAGLFRSSHDGNAERMTRL